MDIRWCLKDKAFLKESERDGSIFGIHMPAMWLLKAVRQDPTVVSTSDGILGATTANNTKGEEVGWLPDLSS